MSQYIKNGWLVIVDERVRLNHVSKYSRSGSTISIYALRGPCHYIYVPISEFDGHAKEVILEMDNYYQNPTP